MTIAYALFAGAPLLLSLRRPGSSSTSRGAQDRTTSVATWSIRIAHCTAFPASARVTDEAWYWAAGFIRRRRENVWVSAAPTPPAWASSATAWAWLSVFLLTPVRRRQIASLELMPEETADEVAALNKSRSRVNSAAARNSCALARWARASSNAPTSNDRAGARRQDPVISVQEDRVAPQLANEPLPACGEDLQRGR
jgi:hypothetical protein